MEDGSTPLLSYTAWRLEAARISELALKIPCDDRLTALQRRLSPSAVADAKLNTASTPSPPAPTSSSFFSQLFSTSATNATTQPAMPWCPSLAQLLALAEMPPPNTPESTLVDDAVGDDAHGTSSSSSSAVHRGFAHIITAMANNQDGIRNDQKPRRTSLREGKSFVLSSHAILPGGSSFSSSTAIGGEAASTGGPAATSSSFTASHTKAMYDEGDDEGDGGFDRMFARLKQQAAERSQQPSGPHARLPRRASDSSVSQRQTEAKSDSLPATHVGLSAARAALDATDTLLLRVRQQNQLSTAASGRITEAQTLLLRATVCRESQMYMERIRTIVDDLVVRHGVEPQHSSRKWAASLLSNTPAQLNAQLSEALISEGSLLTQPPRSPHAGNWSLDRPGGNSTYPAGNRTATQLATQTSNGTNPATSSAATAAGARGSVFGGSPTSASSMSLFYAPHNPSTEATLFAQPASPSARAATQGRATCPPALSADVVALLHQWRQLVETQQRALRCAEVLAYVAASQLFLGAAAERMQFGCCGVKEEKEEEEKDVEATGRPAVGQQRCSGVMMHTPSADLASHGVTHLLRACGLLLSDHLLEQEIAYPVSLLQEVEAELRAPTTAIPTAAASLLIATPHAPQVWMLLARLATVFERRRLQLPWDRHESSECSSSSPSRRVCAASAPPVARLAAPSSIIQTLWEVSAAVLLFRAEDALRALPTAASHVETSHAPSPQLSFAAPHVRTSLHELFCELTKGASAASSAAGQQPQQQQCLTVQPGMLPLCLLSLRRATAAAVRTGQHIEALRDVEIALYLLASENSITDEDEGPTPPITASAAAEEAEANAGTTRADYRKVAYWPVAATTSASADKKTFTRTATCAPVVTLMEDRIHFILMRVLLLLLATPLTAGDAAAVLFRHGELSNRAPSSVHDGIDVVAATPGRVANSHRSDATNPQSTTARCSPRVATEPAASARPAAAATPARDVNGVLGEKEAISAPVRSVVEVLQLSLRAVQDMAHQLCQLEEGGWVEEHRNTPCGSTTGAGIPPFIPRTEYRFSTVLKASAAAAAAAADTGARKDADNDTHATSPMSQEQPSSAVAEVAAAALAVPDPARSSHISRAPAKCTLTSSARFQQLKRKYQSQQQQQQQQQPLVKDNIMREEDENKAAEGTSSLPYSAPSGQHAAREANWATTEGDGEDDAPSRPAALSTLLEEFYRLLQELLLMVCFLTLPLRARSTCVVTPETALPLPRGATGNGSGSGEGGGSFQGPSGDGSTSEEAGYDKECSHARRAMSKIDSQLEDLLGRLGARDRVLFTVLRRLRKELLFPAVCGPPM